MQVLPPGRKRQPAIHHYICHVSVHLIPVITAQDIRQHGRKVLPGIQAANAPLLLHQANSADRVHFVLIPSEPVHGLRIVFPPDFSVAVERDRRCIGEFPDVVGVMAAHHKPVSGDKLIVISR